MPQAEVNWFAVIVSVVVYMAVGFAWYGPLFGKKWIELSRVDMSGGKEAMKKEMPRILGLNFVLAVVTFYVLACAIDYSGAFTAVEGAMTAFWLWAGFIFSSAAVGYLYEKKPLMLLAINTGYSLVTLVLGGMILAIWI